MAQNRWMRGVMTLVFAGLIYGRPLEAQTQSQLNLMPWPSSVQAGSGSLRIDASFSVAQTGHTEARLDRAVQRFLQQLSRQTAIPFPSKGSGSSKATLVVHTDHASKEVQEVGEDETYVLEVTADGAKLTAPTPLGTMHGLQTFLQLVEVSPDGFAVPGVTIQDQPRFPWRGLMIDVSRHFAPLDILKRNLDGLEAVKMNVFHWHLSENQGFRAESKKFPKLHEMGSDGLYYTQEDIRDLIAYARDRGIRVVPEFDVPGHSTAWFVGYPELASGPGPYGIERKWGVFDPAMDPTNEKTYKFLDELIAEMAKLFPDHFFHIGGDEVNGKQWDGNPKIQQFMKSHSLKNNEALQAYFSQRVQSIVTKHGKAVVGWDEVFIQGVPKDIVIQSWRGQASLAQAAAQGYRGILSNGYYLDLGWSTARHYAVDPMGGAAANLTPEQQKRILGGESCMWSEYVNAENVDSRIWPRNAAIADRLWSPQSVTDPVSMYKRLHAVSADVATHRRRGNPRRIRCVARAGRRCRAREGLYPRADCACRAHECDAHEPRRRCGVVGERCGAAFWRVGGQICRSDVPRCGFRSPAARSARIVARQRCSACASRAAVFSGEGGRADLAGLVGTWHGRIGGAGFHRERRRGVGWMEGGTARCASADSEAEGSALADASGGGAEIDRSCWFGRELQCSETVKAGAAPALHIVFGQA